MRVPCSLGPDTVNEMSGVPRISKQEVRTFLSALQVPPPSQLAARLRSAYQRLRSNPPNILFPLVVHLQPIELLPLILLIITLAVAL